MVGRKLNVGDNSAILGMNVAWFQFCSGNLSGRLLEIKDNFSSRKSLKGQSLTLHCLYSCHIHPVLQEQSQKPKVQIAQLCIFIICIQRNILAPNSFKDIYIRNYLVLIYQFNNLVSFSTFNLSTIQLNIVAQLLFMSVYGTSFWWTGQRVGNYVIPSPVRCKCCKEPWHWSNWYYLY